MYLRGSMRHGKTGKEANTSDQVWRPIQANRLCHQIEEGRRFGGKSVAVIHGACGKRRRELRWRLGPDENVQRVMYVYARNHEADERSADHVSQHRAIAELLSPNRKLVGNRVTRALIRSGVYIKEDTRACRRTCSCSWKTVLCGEIHLYPR
jgi:hypothetical protein